MEKSLYQAPEGVEANLSEDPLEFEIGLPEDSALDIEIVADGGEEFSANLAEFMDERDLASLGSELLALVEADIHSRKDWADTYVKGLEVLGMRYDERTEPWAGACGVYSTVLAEAAIRFQSETIMETFPAAGPVKVEIIGATDRKKEEASVRVRDDMNYQITEKMPEYRPEHERMLYSLGLAGAAFKKVYFDTALGRQVSMFIPAEDVIIPYGASGSQTAERVTHTMRKTKNELRRLQVAGFYRDIELGDPTRTNTDIEKKKAEQQGYTLHDDDRYQLLEVQVDYDLPGYEDEDGIALPYIVTLDKGTGDVLSVYRNWDERDEQRTKRQHLVQYAYIPGFGAYGLGLIHLIGGYARAGTSIIRELVDAGQLSNLPGGMKSRGLRIKGDDTPIAPGEFRDVDVSSGTLRDNIMPLPYKEPSQVLLALLNQITEEARRLGAISDMNISDMSANAPVGTTLALLERTLKTMSAVQARVHYAMKQEFKLLAGIIRDNCPDEYEYTPDGTQDRHARKADYDMVEVIPVSDPNSSTMAQRIMQYQAAIQLAQGAPQIYDLPQLHRQMLEVLGIKNAGKLIPATDDQNPRDPVSENMAFLNGKPNKAFIYQDHDAHIMVHQTFMQDPTIAAAVGQNPMAQQMQAAIQAHICEHLAYKYRTGVEQQLGVPMSDPDAEMSEEMEVQLSRLVARAATQLLQVNQQQVAQQQAQQQAQDPLIQMQMQELELKGQEVQIKGKKVDADIAIAQQKLQLEAQKGGPAPVNPMHAEQAHAMEMQSVAQQQQQAAQEHQLELQKRAQLHAQQLAQGQRSTAMQAQLHNQGLAHKQQLHQVKLQNAAKPETPNGQ
jgi:hypothetical protein